MFKKSLLLAAPTALLLSGTSVFALTADQVWADLQALASGSGGEIKAATEVKEEGIITLNGVSVGPAGGPAVITIAEVSIEDQDDGSVAFFPADIKVTPPDGTMVAIEDQELTVSVFEDEGGLGYALFADLLKVSFDATEGTAESPKRNAGSVTFEGLEAGYGRGADIMSVDLVAKRMAYDLTQVDKAMMLDSTSVSDTADLSLVGELTIPAGVNLMALDGPGAFEDAVSKGLALTAAMTSGLSKGTTEERGEMMPMTVTFEGASSTMNIAADKTSMMIEGASSGLKAEVTPPGMPMSFPVSMDSLSMAYMMPVSAPDGGAYQLKLNLANLVLGESVWAMFDPSAALARDPANLALDVSGQAKFDLLATMAAEGTGTAPPVPEPVSLDIKELGFKLAGAALSGTGAFTFDNSMMAMGGPPMPLGTANLRLEGGNKLIDGLIATGLLKEEDAMGARMMMAMFGKPDGDDVLTSQIEAKEGGSIFVNGQQIQ